MSINNSVKTYVLHFYNGFLLYTIDFNVTSINHRLIILFATKIKLLVRNFQNEDILY